MKEWMPWVRVVAAWGFLALAGAYFLIVGLMIWKGGTWAYIIYAEDPIAHLAGGLVCLFAWYVLDRGHKNSAAQWRTFAAKLVLLSISVGLSLLVGEVGLRAILIKKQEQNSLSRLAKLEKSGARIPIRSHNALAAIIQVSDDANLFYELKHSFATNFGGHTLEINADGLRDSVTYAEERSPQSVRIVGIGDSGMFGWNLDQDRNYLDVLEANLNARTNGVAYEVLNLAVPGYNTQLEVECLRDKGLKYKPDMVIVGWCENDFFLPFFMLQKENFRRRDVSYLYDLLFRRAHFVEAAAGRQFVDRHSLEFEQVDEHMKMGVDKTGVTEAFMDLKRLGEEHGFRVLVFGPMNENVTSICDAAGLSYFNTKKEIPDDLYPLEWAVHFMHPRAEGHRVLAEHLEKTLEERGWLTPAQTQARAGSPRP